MPRESRDIGVHASEDEGSALERRRPSANSEGGDAELRRQETISEGRSFMLTR